MHRLDIQTQLLNLNSEQALDLPETKESLHIFWNLFSKRSSLEKRSAPSLLVFPFACRTSRQSAHRSPALERDVTIYKPRTLKCFNLMQSGKKCNEHVLGIWRADPSCKQYYASFYWALNMCQAVCIISLNCPRNPAMYSLTFLVIRKLNIGEDRPCPKSHT